MKKNKKNIECKTVTDYLRPFKLYVVLTVTVKFIATFAELFLPSTLSYMVDTLAPAKDVKKMVIFGLIMVLCALVALVGNITANRMAAKTASRITQRLRHDVYVKTLSLSCQRTDEFTVPTLISRLTSDTYNLHNMLRMVQQGGIRGPIIVIGGIIITFFLDKALTLILVALMPIVFTLIFFISRKGVKIYGSVQKTSDEMVSVLRENMEGVRVIKALSKTEYERERFADVNERIYRNDRKAGITTGLSGPVMNVFLNLGFCAVILAGAYRVNAGHTQPGVIIAFLSYFTLILMAMMMINRIFMLISKGVASGKRLNEILAAPSDDDFTPASSAAPSDDNFTPASSAAPSDDNFTPVSSVENGETENPESVDNESSYHVSFENVTFSYLKKRNNLENLSFGLKKGETLGIIGSTGSGKTTIINLLLRFYKADSGQVKINGKNIDGIPRSELYKMFGSALQTDFLMSDTIKENIRFERDITDEEITYAAVAALADGFIRDKTDGYEHLLDVKAANLSGGQKQRLLIARAIAGKPDILILDDSCSALDYKTDSLLRGNLGRDYAESTKILIAQRVSTVMNADLIIVMDDGEVVGIGKHSELMESCELYRETANAQMSEGNK